MTYSFIFTVIGPVSKHYKDNQISHHSYFRWNSYHTFTIFAVRSVRASGSLCSVVHGVRGGIRGHGLHGTVIRVVLIKHVADVTEEPRRWEVVQQGVFVLVHDIAVVLWV